MSLMIRNSLKEAQYFFYSQAFADGLRASFAIILPAIIGSWLGYFQTGLTISLGAMCISLTDAPGPIVHKRNGMLIAVALAFFSAAITGLANTNVFSMALVIALFTFFFSMFAVYGNRATSVGNAAILIMILTMDPTAADVDPVLQPFLILAGGLFYFMLSMVLYFIRPYRNAQRALGDCIREVASYLYARSDFYDLTVDVDQNYRKVITQQIAVNEKQDAVRELFFKTRQIVQETTEEGRKLVFTFVETVDLFEEITAAYYDYNLLREQFRQTGALEHIHISLKKVALELDRIGIAIQNNSSFSRGFDYDEEVRRLKSEMDQLLKDVPNSLVLKKIIVNIRNLLNGLTNIAQYFDRKVKRKKSNVDHSHFISHQLMSPVVLWNNISMESSIFRHSLRVCIACLAGFAVSRIVAYGEHSYWILLTIAFILKPAFSLTKKRNIERIIGTLAGGVLGILILIFITNKTILLILLILFMVGTYSFLRINYLMMVFFTTPYVLILFSFFGFVFRDVVRERILDTLIGCAIAFTVSYLLFPKWESEQLRGYMKGMLKANCNYLQKILEALQGKIPSMLDYKLARKEVYLNSANMSAAFERMLSEPRNKQNNVSLVHQFVVLNHILFSNLASIATTLLSQEPKAYPGELIQLARNASKKIEESIKLFEPGTESKPIAGDAVAAGITVSSDDRLMKEQLQFIYRVSTDLEKTIRSIA